MSAFFIVSLFNFSAAVADVCKVKSYDDSAMVKYVVDGDTLVLSDNRKVRFIGINTPELERYPVKPEVFALQAKRYLESVLRDSKKIYLSFGAQSQDRYGRLLAHIFLDNGRNVNAMLLEQGLASVIAIPPNVKLLRCYLHIERLAQKKRKNIWGNKYSDYIDAKNISLSNTGYHFIKGKVIRVGRSRDAVYLQLASKFTLRIKHQDFKYFNALNLNELTLEQLANKSIYVRGWVYRRKNELYLQLRHEAMFKLL